MQRVVKKPTPSSLEIETAAELEAKADAEAAKEKASADADSNLRGRLDSVMARLHHKLEAMGNGGAEAEAARAKLCPRTTQRASDAFRRKVRQLGGQSDST